MTSAAKWCSKFLGYEFSSPELLERALTHKSRSANNNERLEFLGDAVLGLVIAEALYRQEKIADEGTLSRMRALLVRRETLAELAAEYQLGDSLLLGSGEARSGGHQRLSILADGLEAVFGALLLDAGFTATRTIILQVFADRLSNLPDPDQLKDSKTLLQEELQARSMPVPVYTVVGEEGPPHARQFEVVCCIGQLGIECTGKAASRRIAEQIAAEQALALLGTRDEYA